MSWYEPEDVEPPKPMCRPGSGCGLTACDTCFEYACVRRAMWTPGIVTLLDGFEREIEAAEEHLASRGKGGQQVSFHGDFAGAAPSTLGRLRWWLRAFREALR